MLFAIKNSIRTKLLALLLSFTFLQLILLFSNSLLDKQKNSIYTIQNQIDNLVITVLKRQYAIQNYLNYDVRSEDYFSSGKSYNLESIEESQISLLLQINSLIKSEKYTNKPLMNELKELVISSNKNFHIIERIIRSRGYKNFGRIGRMREAAHLLEDVTSIPRDQLLMLRRHEKDFLLRHEEKYIDRFTSLADKIKLSLKKADASAVATANILEKYQFEFLQLSDIDSVLGLHNNSSKTGELNVQILDIARHAYLIENLNKQSTQQKLKSYSRVETILTIIIIIASMLLGWILSSRISSRIKRISESTLNFVKGKFKGEIEVTGDNKSSDEIGQLTRSINILKKEIQFYIRSLENEVEKRTEHISEQNNLITTQNNTLIDSIKYAQRIQYSLMLPEDSIKKLFPHSGLIYNPQNIVSGDFYWFKQYVDEAGNTNKLFAIADCTGHGVPGAFMSLLGISFLNEITSKSTSMQTGHLLNKLREKFVTNFEINDQYSLSDGMDISLINVNSATNELTFSGAFHTIYIIRDSRIIELKGNRMPIGKDYMNYIDFSQESIILQDNDVVYTFTDGFTDQFGGEKGKKITKRRVKKKLIEISGIPIESQFTELRKFFNDWSEDYEQTDDVCLFGFLHTSIAEENGLANVQSVVFDTKKTDFEEPVLNLV